MPFSIVAFVLPPTSTSSLLPRWMALPLLLPPFSIVMSGPKDAGKSSLVDALRLIADAARLGLPTALEAQGASRASGAPATTPRRPG